MSQQWIVTFLIGLMAGTMAFAESEKSADDLQLEEKVAELMNEGDTKTLNFELKTEISVADSAGALRAFKARGEAGHTQCADAKKELFAQKYVLTTDAEGKPCRIYDLSFPNTKALFAGKKAFQVPVQGVASADFLSWLNGDLDAVTRKTENFKRRFNARQAARTSWVSRLKFRKAPELVFGLPKSFSAADLDIGGQFQFDMKTNAEIQSLIIDLKNSEAAGINPIASEFMLKVLSKPETLLEAVHFKWNELDKAYDVILQGDFLPINGPVALIDYQTPYKFAVEKMFRSIIAGGLSQLARFIPVPMVSSAIQVVVEDTFEQIELMYSYQTLQLEDTLRRGSEAKLESFGVNVEYSNQALNLLFGQKSDLLSSYIMAVAQGKAFDWSNFGALGKSARYGVEKQREIAMSKMNSKLVLDKQCKVEFVHDYYASCTRGGKKDALYSLISEQIVFKKSFGAPVIYRYQRPYETAVRRGGTWLLSMGLRIVGLPINRNITYRLDRILKNYMITGLLDEAILKNSFSGQEPALNLENSNMLKWLYIQNLNPFLPKSQLMEHNLIDANKRLLNL